jgi:exosortase D (VPLPA-CTERM-specific)
LDYASVGGRGTTGFPAAWYLWWAIALVVTLTLGYTFRDGLWAMTQNWETEEYSHGYIIPIVSLLLVWHKREELARLPLHGSWHGALVVILGLVIFVLGELGTLYTVIQYAFLITLAGFVLAAIGWRAVRVLWVPLIYLVFMVPLPDFLYAGLSQKLQLISSEWGVFVIRLFDISVFLDGNIIDLGEYKLQIVEACSGLRYLFPLMSFGFICAYLLKAPVWQKAVLFLSTIPVTIVMNSIRIGIVGLLVEFYSIEMAKGFVHDFQGWLVFMSCVLVLVGEIWLLGFLSRPRRAFKEMFPLDFMSTIPVSLPRIRRRPPNSALVSVLVLLIATVSATFLIDRAEAVPGRKIFATFPMKLDSWHGERVVMDKKVIAALKLDDWISADYLRLWDQAPVNFYVAYYDTQRKGASTHSPQACLPGGGWEIISIEKLDLLSVRGDDRPLKVNRVVIEKQGYKQLLYYWFQQRDRQLTNEYAVKWYLFWDAITQNRTDGALLRVATFLPEDGSMEDADQRLLEFLNSAYPELVSYLPQN